MNKGYWAAAIAVALILVFAVSFQRDEQLAVSDAASDFTPLEQANGDSSAGVSEGRSGAEPAANAYPDISENAPIDAGAAGGIPNATPLSVSQFPELSLPPDIGMHEEAAIFASEGRDLAWSAEMEGRLYDGIAQAETAANTMQVECRQSLCRVYISYPAGTEVSVSTGSKLSALFQSLEATASPGFFGFVDRLPVRIFYVSRNDDAAL